MSVSTTLPLPTIRAAATILRWVAGKRVGRVPFPDRTRRPPTPGPRSSRTRGTMTATDDQAPRPDRGPRLADRVPLVGQAAPGAGQGAAEIRGLLAQGLPGRALRPQAADRLAPRLGREDAHGPADRERRSGHPAQAHLPPALPPPLPDPAHADRRLLRPEERPPQGRR